MIATRIQEFQDELDTIQLPAMTKSEMLDQMIGDVRHIQSTIDCMHRHARSVARGEWDRGRERGRSVCRS